MISVVLDTNIVVSANLNSGGLEALVVSLALNRKFNVYVSSPILTEYEQVLLYPRLKFAREEVSKFLALVTHGSTMVRPTHTVSASRDETDNRFLECAESAGADYLVTGNKRHFPNYWKKTRTVNARELLSLTGSSFLK
jgi:putative PIN family toxin of toxin-antitoxin system